MTGQAADDLVKRGYGDLIGVTLNEWEGMLAKGEFFEFDPSATCTAQKNRKMIEIKDPRVEVLSWSYRPIDGEKKKLSPAVTLLDRGEGKISVVFCGTPDAEHNYMEGFAFLNESRKHQLVDIFARAGALPVYYDGDEEVILRAGRLKDGRLLAAFINLGYDPLDTFELVCDFVPTEITYLTPDGKEEKIDFTASENGRVSINAELLPMYPLVLFMK